MTTISLLAKLSKFHNQKLYKDITRESILTFLDNLRKPEGFDPLHKWIGMIWLVNLVTELRSSRYEWSNHGTNVYNSRFTMEAICQRIYLLYVGHHHIFLAYVWFSIWTKLLDLLLLTTDLTRYRGVFKTIVWRENRKNMVVGGENSFSNPQSDWCSQWWIWFPCNPFWRPPIS